jgi:hypothetical protein
LDANVLVDAQVRDLFLSLADAGHVELRWSATVLDELHHTLINRRGLPADKVTRLCDAIRDTFAEMEVLGFPLLPTLDPKDRHVLGAAVHSECDLLVTHNRSDFPSDEQCAQWDLQVTSPDEAFAVILDIIGIATLTDTFERVTAQLRRPPRSVADQLGRLERVAPMTAIGIGSRLGIGDYAELLADAEAAVRDDDARSVVWDLLAAVADGDDTRIDELLTIDARRHLGDTPKERLARLRAELHGPLTDSPEQWGFATKTRLAGPGREYLKLVRTGGRPIITREPTLVQAVVFEMDHDGTMWRVHQVGIPDPAFDDPR